VNWNPWAGAPGNYHLSIAALVANGTMDAEIAGTLWAAADEQLPFLTVAVPRNAGKTTVASAILGLRRPDVPLNFALGEPRELEQLRRERRGGYLVIGEFSPWPMPSYIWGESVRQVFGTVQHGYSLQTSLHAPGVQPAIEVITREIGISDEDASHIRLVVYIEVVRAPAGETKRRVAEVFEVEGVSRGIPAGRTLFRWRRDGDQFEKLAEPTQFAADSAVLARRRAAIAALAARGRTSIQDVESMRESFEAEGS
jgi:hypothetical protein